MAREANVDDGVGEQTRDLTGFDYNASGRVVPDVRIVASGRAIAGANAIAS
jgi:hypothetical protein